MVGCLLIGAAAAIVGAAAASFFDLRCGRIPNLIPAAMLLLSFPLAAAGGYLGALALNVASAFVFFYLFWVLGVWGGGDSKLMIGVAALVPVYPVSAVLPGPFYGGFFFLSVVFNMLLLYLLYVFAQIVRCPGGGKMLRSTCAALLLLPFLPAAAFLFFAFEVYFEGVRVSKEKGEFKEMKMSPLTLAALVLSLSAGDVFSLFLWAGW